MLLLDTSYWRIQHFPHKGKGVVAHKQIAPGTIIGDYLGKIIPIDKDDESHGLYSMWYGTKALIFPDRHTPGIHFMNYSCMPNCGMYPYKDHMLFAAIRTIFPGEELTVCYYLLPEKSDTEVHICNCGTPLCRGTMYVSKSKFDAFERVEKTMRGDYFYHQMTAIGKQLLPFPDYPKDFPDMPIHDLYGSLTEKPLTNSDEVLPMLPRMRSLIRESGKRILFPKLGFTVLGIADSQYIIIPLSK